MPLPVIVILDILIVYFFFGDTIGDTLLPKRWRSRRTVRHFRKALRTRYRRNCDLMDEKIRRRYTETLSEAEEALAGSAAAVIAFEGRIHRQEFSALLAPAHRGAWRLVADYLEVLVVSVGVAFCIRSLLIQPFKIPTGSMQPTLYGIHYQPLPPEVNCRPGALRSFFDYINYSRRYIDFSAGEDGLQLDVQGIRQLANAFVFFPRTLLPYAGGVGGGVVFPADQNNLVKAVDTALGGSDGVKAHLGWETGGRIHLRIAPNERLFHGAMESGDHLFVNRMSFAYHSPRRGEVMVFCTKGLEYRGEKLAGDFYIKRLIGLPGDTLKIVNRRVYVRPEGAAEFKALDASVHPSFDKVYSMKNGYSGHSTVGQYGEDVVAFRRENDEFTVPAGHYFLMGDNTDNSLDCRFFGAVPKENLIGRPCFVWWPFSSRFGTVDRN